MPLVITNQTAAIPLTDTSTQFTVTDPFVLTGMGFNGWIEKAELYRLMADGEYHLLTKRDSAVLVKDFPNAVLIDIPGTYRVVKTVTLAEASVAYEELV